MATGAKWTLCGSSATLAGIAKMASQYHYSEVKLESAGFDLWHVVKVHSLGDRMRTRVVRKGRRYRLESPAIA